MIGISIATKWEWEATINYYKIDNYPNPCHEKCFKKIKYCKKFN